MKRLVDFDIPQRITRMTNRWTSTPFNSTDQDISIEIKFLMIVLLYEHENLLSLEAVEGKVWERFKRTRIELEF